MERSITTLKPGPLSTVQDLGRVGMQHLGFSPGGAADRYAAEVGNLLLGNAPTAAVIEVTLGDATFRCESAGTVAVTGAEAPLSLDGCALQPWQTRRVAAGAVLQIGPARRGARVYLCVGGGIDVPLRYGSRSTDLLAQVGGYEGRALRVGDRLPVGVVPLPAEERRLAPALRPLYQRLTIIRAVPGPQDAAFTARSRSAFFASLYRVSPRADRTGLFLDGPRLFHTHSADILSEGVTSGSIQVPATGQPLVLLAEHRSIGGYTKIATVCSADLPRLGQARPGDLVMFVAIDHQAAQRARVALGDATACAAAAQDAGGDGGYPLQIDEWLDRIAATAAEMIADERLDLLWSDLERLVAVVGGRERPDVLAPTLQVRGHVVTPDAAYPSLQVRAPHGGTVLALDGDYGNIPSGTPLALIWSPGACTLVVAGHALAHLVACRTSGAWVDSGDVLFEGGFLTAASLG